MTISNIYFILLKKITSIVHSSKTLYVKSHALFHMNMKISEIKYMVVEELDLKKMPEVRKAIANFQKKCKNSRQDVTPMDISVRHVVRKLHIVHLKKPAQVIFYPNLHLFPHYSIGNNEMLQLLLDIASMIDIECKHYINTQDHLLSEGNNIIVLNKNTNNDILRRELQFHIIEESFEDAKRDVNRNTNKFSAGLTGQKASGWTYKKCDLDRPQEEMILKREGFADNIKSDKCKKSIGMTLRYMGTVINGIMKRNGETLFSDNERQRAFSAELAKILGIKSEIFFEGTQINENIGQIQIHCDYENCREHAYRFTGVFSQTINEKRISVIGYSRKRACYYAKREKSAFANKVGYKIK